MGGRTVVTKGARGERFVHGDNVRVADARPLLDGGERGLMNQPVI
jgi:hypothetical protein